MTDSQRKRPSSASLSTTTDAPDVTADVAAVFSGLPGGVISGGEIVLLAIKPSMWRPVFDSAAWVLSACLLAAILTTVGQPIPGLSLSATAQVILLIGFAKVGIATAQWAPQWHVLTNRRIIDISGIRQPQVTSCPLVDIRNTYARRSAAERVARIGSILFVTTDSASCPHVWRSIRNHDAAHARIRRAIENALDSQHV